jgi:hypothetical protein
MAVNIIHIPSYALSDNPVVLTLSNTGDADETVTVKVGTLIKQETIFTESYVVAKKGVLFVDVSEVLKSNVATPELPDGSDDTSDVSGGFGTVNGVRFIILHGESVLHTSSLQVRYGKFSDRELLRRELTSEALIKEKLIEQRSNPNKVNPAPFFSLRNHSYAVNLYEGELLPLFFMSKENCTVRVLTSSGEEVHSNALEAYGSAQFEGIPLHTFYLDLAPLVTDERKYFKVILGGNDAQAVHVTLSPNPTTRALHEVMFLSSLGFYEKLLLTGTATRTRNLEGAGDDGEAPTRQEFVPHIQLYRKVGVRRNVKETITLSAGYTTPDRLLLVADMMNSERIYLDGEAVICTSSELVTNADTDTTEPREVELTFMLANT